MLIFVRLTVDFLGRFFFTFNFNDIPLSMYYIYLSSFMFFVFIFLNIMCIVHFEARSLSVEHIKCFHMCVSIHCLMSTIGPQGVLCAL
jgi:hypothetical protein